MISHFLSLYRPFLPLIILFLYNIKILSIFCLPYNSTQNLLARLTGHTVFEINPVLTNVSLDEHPVSILLHIHFRIKYLNFLDTLCQYNQTYICGIPCVNYHKFGWTPSIYIPIFISELHSLIFWTLCVYVMQHIFVVQPVLTGYWLAPGHNFSFYKISFGSIMVIILLPYF